MSNRQTLQSRRIWSSSLIFAMSVLIALAAEDANALGARQTDGPNGGSHVSRAKEDPAGQWARNEGWTG